MKSSYHINRKIVDKLVKKYQQYKINQTANGLRNG